MTDCNYPSDKTQTILPSREKQVTQCYRKEKDELGKTENGAELMKQVWKEREQTKEEEKRMEVGSVNSCWAQNVDWLFKLLKVNPVLC